MSTCCLLSCPQCGSIMVPADHIIDVEHRIVYVCLVCCYRLTARVVYRLS